MTDLDASYGDVRDKLLRKLEQRVADKHQEFRDNTSIVKKKE